MATDLQTRTASSPKFETFVDQQLSKVRQRLRAIDLGAAALVLLAITLGYAAAMAIFDLFVRGSSESWVNGVRLAAFGLYLLGMAAGAAMFVMRLLRRINPYYCARQLELTLPDAKNSVVNWLDLKEEHLPSAIRNSLGLRAAKDLKEADADQVADPKPTWFMGSVAGALFVVLVVVFALSPNQFGSLLARAFLPFRDITLANRASIKLLKPAGDVEVRPNRRVEFVAEIDGRFPKANDPQAPTLWYRYGPSEPFVPAPLDEDGNGQWTKTLAADQVQNGLWYKISAGDAETPVYQITTRSLPEAKRFEVTYHYRPYRKLPDETVVFPNEFAVFPELRGERGTDVSLVVRTNQPVREGWLHVNLGDGPKNVPGQRLEDDPAAFRCKFTLERSGQYRVLFTSKSEDSNIDRSDYRIDVRDDLPPAVVITKPAEHVSRAANGTLTVEGLAQDDFGVKGMMLRLRVLEGDRKPILQGLPYRPDKKFQFDTGAYPTKLDYLDVLALDQLKTENGQPFPLSPNMVLEYWLEATDNSDYPSAAGNVGRSLPFKIKIDPPKDEKQKKDERQQAQDQKDKHDKNQDQQHQQENKDKKNEAARNGSGKTPEQQKAEDLKNELDQKKKDIDDKLKKQEQQQNQGAGKGNDPDKAENKGSEGAPPDTNAKNDPKSGAAPQTAGDKKDGGQGDKKDAPKSAEAKGPGDNKQDPQNPPDKQIASEPKGAGNEKPQPTAKGADGDNKSGTPPEQQPASAKAGPKDNQPKEQPGQGKDQGKASDSGMNKTSQSKDNAPKNEDKANQGAQAKGAEGNKDAPPPQAKGDKKDPKDQAAAGKKGDSKQGSGEQLTKEKGPGNANKDAQASKNPPGADGTRKPADAKGDVQPDRKAQAKEGPGGQGADWKQGPPAQVKNQPKSPNAADPKNQPEGAAKETPADQAKESATTKNETGDSPPREPTMKDLERLKDLLAKNDPKALKSADELKRNLPESTDPKVGKAGEDLLKDAAQKLEEMANAQEKKDQANSAGAGPEQNPMSPMGDPMKAQGGNEVDPKAKKGDDPQSKLPGQNTAKTKGQGGSGPNGENVADNLKPRAANKDFADRLSNLQLEELKKRASPESLKRANISDAEWQQFLKEAEAYEQLRQKLQSQPTVQQKDRVRTQGGKLPSTGPRQFVNPAASNDPASIGRSYPPPELRQAQDIFTRPKQ